ncbi:hypothetical protein ACE198_26860 [Neobacillus sp. KR4-4]|uniref:hypothetical protein n=1 Tax=Neobacillus sp. KR4-4 TaxID=3344872 RepID=UPI0035CB41F1
MESILVDHAKEMMKKGLLNSDIVKLSEEFGIKVFKSTKKETMIGYNVEKEEMYISKKLG